MATLLLSAAGMAIGGSVGGTVLGLSTAVAGRFVGATLGRVIDQRLMGAGSEVIESGQVDTLRLTGASEGAPLGQVFGRMRIGGQTSKSYSYSVSLAVALCEGPITCIGRIWADGIEIAADDLNLRVYTGDEAQQQDPTIVAYLGADCAPAYRGTAYLVIEDLDLGQFGNRVPQCGRIDSGNRGILPCYNAGAHTWRFWTQQNGKYQFTFGQSRFCDCGGSTCVRATKLWVCVFDCVMVRQ